MEGVFAFFLESTFLGLFLFGEKRLGPRRHLAAAVALCRRLVALGLLHHRHQRLHAAPGRVHAWAPDGALQLADFWAFLLNPWALWQYAHNMTASVVTASFVVAAVGAYWTLLGRAPASTPRICAAGRRHRRAGRLRACMLFPTGDRHGQAGGRASAGHARRDGGAVRERARTPSSRSSASPTSTARRLENPIVVPGMLSFLAYGIVRQHGHTGSNDFPTDQWPDNIELLYYAYHIMVGPRDALHRPDRRSPRCCCGAAGSTTSPRLLWVLMLAFPFPYIATTAGWMTAELGRQPWLVYGLMRTADGTSPRVSAGERRSSPLLGFAGLYLRARRALPLPGRPGDRRRARSAPRRCRRGGRRPDGSALVRDRRRHARGLRRARRLRLRRRHPPPASSRGPTPSGAPCSRPSARSGTATRSG